MVRKLAANCNQSLHLSEGDPLLEPQFRPLSPSVVAVGQRGLQERN
jgi:hypothetical protein